MFFPYFTHKQMKKKVFMSISVFSEETPRGPGKKGKVPRPEKEAKGTIALEFIKANKPYIPQNSEDIKTYIKNNKKN